MAYTFGLPTAGLFAFALQMISVPAALLGQSVATILFPRFADGERAGGIHRSELDRCIVGLAAMSVPMFIPVIVLGPQIFSLVFGQPWEEAGQIAAILAPWVAVSFISSAVSSLALVKRRFRMITLIGVIETSVRFGAIAIGGVAGSQFLGIGLFALVGIAIPRIPNHFAALGVYRGASRTSHQTMLRMVSQFDLQGVITPAVDLLRDVVVTGVGLGAWAAGFNSVMAVLLMSIGLTCIYVITWFLGLRIVSSRTQQSPQN